MTFTVIKWVTNVILGPSTIKGVYLKFDVSVQYDIYSDQVGYECHIRPVNHQSPAFQV